MREILFRGKRIDNGEWVDGYPVKYPSGKVEIFKECGEPPDVLLILEVNPETICQYTGLKDKHGNQIWENDIVLLREEMQNYEWKAMVKFGNPNCEYHWGWQLVPIGECDMNKDILLWVDMEIATCEVVGNIFDNPELTKGE